MDRESQTFPQRAGRGGNTTLKSFLKKTKQSLQTGCLFPFPFSVGLSGRSPPAGREAGHAPELSHTLSPALPLGGNRNTADSNIRHFCGNWQGPRAPPPPPLEHQVSTSATRPVPSGDHNPSSSLRAERASRSFLEPPGQAQPACTLNNKLCILDPSAARGRFSYLSWRPALL